MVDSLIRLFEQNTEPVYSSGHWEWVGLGIGVISDAISCIVEEERNGKYELTMEYPTTGMRYSEFQINRIIVAKPNPEADPQGFRIYQVSKSMERVITINAEHISYKLTHIPILPLSAANCHDALAALFNPANQGEPCDFQFDTDKTSTYFPETSGSVRTGDYQGRALQFDWQLVSQTSTSSTISWTLKGVGKLAGYTNGWVMCGPVNLSIGNIILLQNAHDHEAQGGTGRVQVRENQIIDQGTRVIAHVNGKFSDTINLNCYLYWDENDSGLGRYSGTGVMTLPDVSGGGSDVDVTQAGEFKIEEPTSLRAALGGDKNSVLTLYGGEFEWDNLTVKLHSSRGEDRGATIRYGKNLTTLEQEETIANTITGILPYWKGTEPVDKETNAGGATVIVTPTHILRNGTPLSDIPPAKEGGVDVTVDTVHSANADLFPYHRTQPKNLTDYFNDWSSSQEVTSQTSQLESFWYKVPMPQNVYDTAKEWVAANNLGEPEVNLNVEFVPLWQTEEYKNLAIRDIVGLCDIVHVYFEELGVTVSAKVVTTEYDVLLGRYKSITLSSLGKLKATLATTIASTPALIAEATNETKNFMTVALEDATNRINGAYGGQISYPTDENGNQVEIVIAGDPDSDGTYGNFMRFNKEGIGFSTQGYNGPFNSAWTIDGTFNAQVINVINLNANSMTGGTLKSSNWDSSGGTAGFSANLDTGQFQAPSLELSITGAANSYTDGQVSGAISTAAADATSKANAAQAAAKSYTDTKISVIPGQISSAINSIQIGGRNLLLNTGVSYSYSGAINTEPQSGTTTYWKSTDSYDMIGAYNTLGLTTDDYVTISYDWVITGVPAGTLTMKVGTNAAPWEYFGVVHTFASGSSSGHVEKTMKVSTAIRDSEGVKLRFRFDSRVSIAANTINFTVTNAKLEIGNKATNWTPAPEDLEEYADNAVRSQAQATSSQITQLSDRITSTVTTVNNIQNNMLDSSDVQALIDAGNFATSSSVTQTSDSLQVLITQAQNTANSANSAAQTLTTGVTVDSNGVTVGKSTSAVKGVFSNNSLEFQSGGKAIAWLSADSEEGLGVDTIQIGDHNTANQRWIVFTTSNGSHLSFTRHQ